MFGFRRILLYADPQTSIQPALETVLNLARRKATEIVVADCLVKHHSFLQTFWAGWNDPFAERMKQRQGELESIANQIRAEQIPVKTQLLHGCPADELTREVIRTGHNLLVKTAQGNGNQKERAFFGTTAIHLMRQCPCPVWVVDPNDDGRITRILAAIDVNTDDREYGELNKQVLKTAVYFSEQEQAELLILNAWQPFGPGRISSHMPQDAKEEYIKTFHAEAEQRLQVMLSSCASQIPASSVHLIRGEPGFVIQQFVKDHCIDVVVMGTTARTGLFALIPGNRCEDVMQHVCCNAVILKSKSFVPPRHLGEFVTADPIDTAPSSSNGWNDNGVFLTHKRDDTTSILVVDDSDVERRLVAGLLRQNPHFQIVLAEDGQQALKVMESEPIDLVLTDLVMPEMDGMELTKTVRFDHPRVSVVVMTAHEDPITAQEALRAGAVAFVPKARQSDWLSETIDRVLRRRLLEQKSLSVFRQLEKIECSLRLESDPETIFPFLDFLQDSLAVFYPRDVNGRISFVLAVEEALLNALYHGNLEIDRQHIQNRESKLNGRLAEMVRIRRSQSYYSRRQIIVGVSITASNARVEIQDMGSGFDVENLVRRNGENPYETGHCRGLTLMRSLAGEAIFNDRGNQVTLVAHRRCQISQNPVEEKSSRNFPTGQVTSTTRRQEFQNEPVQNSGSRGFLGTK